MKINTYKHTNLNDVRTANLAIAHFLRKNGIQYQKGCWFTSNHPNMTYNKGMYSLATYSFNIPNLHAKKLYKIGFIPFLKRLSNTFELDYNFWSADYNTAGFECSLNFSKDYAPPGPIFKQADFIEYEFDRTKRYPQRICIYEKLNILVDPDA